MPRRLKRWVLRLDLQLAAASGPQAVPAPSTPCGSTLRAPALDECGRKERMRRLVRGLGSQGHADFEGSVLGPALNDPGRRKSAIQARHDTLRRMAGAGPPRRTVRAPAAAASLVPHDRDAAPQRVAWRPAALEHADMNDQDTRFAARRPAVKPEGGPR